MKVLLDTDITSYIFAHRDERVRRRFLAFAVGDVAISTITAAARVYDQVRTVLRRLGTPIGSHDAQIAAHAISLDVPLATSNVRKFRRVPDLRVESWLA